MRLTLETDRLILRPYDITDAYDMYNNWASDEEVTKYVTWDIHKSIDDTIAIIEFWLLQYDIPERINFVIEHKETKEAKFAYHCDKLECDIQCKLYDEEGCVDLNDQHNDNPASNDPKVIELLKSGYSWSKMWLEYDKSKYLDDNNFMEVLEYVENNDISINEG